VKNKMNFLRLFCAFLFGTIRYGRIWISTGQQEIFVETKFTPKEVYLNYGGPWPSYGCGAGNDGFDVKIVPNGFIIFCNIKSTKRKIKWLAIK